MAKLPNLVTFTCESCGKELQASSGKTGSAVLDVSGRCQQCGAESWTMKVVYSEDSLDMTSFAVDLGLAAVATNFAGVGLTTLVTAGLADWKTDSNEWLYKNIPGCVVAKLNSEPSERMQRIVDLARTMERGKMFEAGAKDCLECGMIFMPADSKSWNDLGYCSRVCATRAESEEPVFVELVPTQDENLVASST